MTADHTVSTRRDYHSACANHHHSPVANMPALRRPVLSMLVAAALYGADTPPDAAAHALEQLRAANQARAELARESAAWATESQRLAALISATKAETARLERDASAAEAARDAAQQRLAALGSGSDLDAMRTRLAEAGERLASELAAIARVMPPGVLPADVTAGDSPFDSAVRSLEVAERSAASVAIEIVTGERDGRSEAVKMLRVAGAAAWWISLDGTAAGPVRMQDGRVMLIPAGEQQRVAIAAALSQSEGRAQPGLVLLPGVKP